MENESRFRPLYPVGQRKPDPKVGFKPKNPEQAQQREEALRSRGSFVAKPPRTPEKCPLCGTLTDDYRNDHGGQEMLLPGGHPFICAVCGNTEWG
jgi:hypothetical protein